MGSRVGGSRRLDWGQNMNLPFHKAIKSVRRERRMTLAEKVQARKGNEGGHQGAHEADTSTGRKRWMNTYVSRIKQAILNHSMLAFDTTKDFDDHKPPLGASPTGTQTLLCKQSSSHALSSTFPPHAACGHTPHPPVNRAGFRFVP